MSAFRKPPIIGIVGFGAFGQLMGRHLKDNFRIYAFDPARTDTADVRTIAYCDIVILAPPVDRLSEAIAWVRPHLRKGAIVLDVCSVKIKPTQLMLSALPDHVEIIGSHPLFGPQSAQGGIRGLKIVLCPLRGGASRKIAAFLRARFGLKVFVTTPEEHDRQMAMIQGLTHLIGKLLVQMGPLPTRMTTRSYEHLMQSVEMVRHDNPALFRAIEHDNPFAKDVRNRFLSLAERLKTSLDAS